MNSALRALLTQTIQHAPLTGRTAYGQPTYGTAVSHPAHIEQRMQTALGPAGAQLIPVITVFVDGDWAIGQNDLVTLPDGSTPPLQGIAVQVDTDGSVAHRVLYM